MTTLRLWSPLVPLVLLSSWLFACADRDPAASYRARASSSKVDAAAQEEAERSADFRLPPVGVPDRGRTSGLVVLEVARSPRCSAVLVASNLALTPLRCLTRLSACGRIAPSSLALRSGDDRRDLVAGVREIVLLDACDDDALAALVLTRHADGLAPLAIRARPAPAGEFLRVVLLTGGRTAGVPERVVRDHLRIESTTRGGLSVAGEACSVLPGGVALDEATGELVGVMVRPVTGEACDAPPPGTCDFVQVDAARSLLERAFSRAAAPVGIEDGGAPVDAGQPRRGKAAKLTADLGDPCETGDDCAAGVCLFEAESGYCSRSCAPGDRCPTGTRCERFAAAAASACARGR